MDRCERCNAVSRHSLGCERITMYESRFIHTARKGRAFRENLMRRKPVPRDGYGPLQIKAATLAAIEQRSRRAAAPR